MFHLLFSLRIYFYQLLSMSFESFQKIPLVMAGRRPGDSETVYASTSKAEKELNWKYVALTLPKHKSIYSFFFVFSCIATFYSFLP